MYKIIDLQQGSPEWENFRFAHVGASDSPIIMGKSPWMTVEEFWLIRSGHQDPRPKTAKMQRGNDLEEEARNLLIDKIKMEFRPIVLQSTLHPFLSASIDGINDDFNGICEIKCPNAKTHEDASNGIIPEYYMIQMQHALMVSDANVCYYFSYRPEAKNQSGICHIIEVFPDAQFMYEMIQKEIQFWKSILDNKAPEGCWIFTHNKKKLS